jgi:predicted acyl esterase
VSGEPARLCSQRRISLQPMLATLHPGDRLRLSIAGAAWPAVGVNPGTPEVASGPPGSRHRVVTMTLELAGSHLSLIPFDSGKVNTD